MVGSDVVVVGAGVVGASVALALARRGRSVVVVDRGPGPGHGSTSASSAIVRFNYSTFAGVALSWDARAAWEVWEDHLGHRDPDGVARFTRCGLAMLDVEGLPWERSAALFTEVGVRHEHWDAATLADRVPGIDTGSWFPPRPVTDDAFFDDPAGQLGALWTPDAGYVDDPRLAAANLLHAAQARGAQARFGSGVASTERVGPSWRLVLEDGQVLESDLVVNAAGPWSSALNRLAGAGGDFTVDVRPLRQEVHQVPVPQDLADGAAPVLADLDLGTYLRPVGGHALLVGGTEPACDPLEWLDDPDDADPHLSRERFDAHTLRAARRLPDLRVPNRPSGVVGVYDVASDWTPVYDRTDLPGWYVAMGTSGNQFKNAPLVGDLVATVVDAVEQGHDHDRDPVRFTLPYTGNQIDLGAFSRLREPNTASSGTVMG
jgi:glycine/D-amino acid oxidase-like deaminating enzyme